MSWSLQITNGDLSLGGRGMNTVTGGSKLTQDLRCIILEPLGNDDMHPTLGSVIDGGVTPDGSYQQGIIGQPNDSTAGAFVYAEIQRITNEYQERQISRNASDVSIYGKSTLTADEALLAVEQIQITSSQDNMLVTATLQTGLGGLPLNVAIGS